MANSFVRYTGDGNTASYSIPFSYRSTADLTVTLAGVATTAFTLNAAGTTLTFTATPSNGTAIEIRRRTSQGTKLVDYASGSVLTENDLDTDSEQAFFMSQEAIDDANDVIRVSNTNFQWDTDNKRLINVADPVDAQDAATKNYLENTWLSATDKATLNNVNSNIAAINTVNSNISDIQQTNSNATNINTVATNITSVNTVATDIAKVIAVANDLAEAVSEVETVADDLNEATSEIDTVANSIANVDLVGNAIGDVQVVGQNITDVQSVANISTNVTSVANNETNINAVNSNSTNINTVAGAITNVNNVGNDIANVNTVATNLTDINSFENTYKISATAPTGVAEGTLWFDTTNDIMKVYDGSAFANAGSSVNGTSQRNKFTATAGQTVFSGNDDDSVLLTYDPNFLDTYLNGVRIINGSDYTATDGSTITLTSGASAGDILSVVSFGTFQLASFSATAITSDTLPVARGGTGLSSLGSSGQALVVNSAGNALEFSNASSAEVYGFTKGFTATTVRYTVTVSSVGGSNKYFINGVQQDTLDLLEGNTYIFSYPSSHPFALSTTANGTHGGGSEYTTGVTRDTSANTLTYVVPSSAPQLYYYCTAHSNMGGTANTPVPANNTLQVVTTNQGVDSITNTQYENFDDVLFSASGFTFSLNASGNLIATI
jgi:hypothetical protein